jgi:ABC-type branched-subunit amino acid transport system substrate-binding protein
MLAVLALTSCLSSQPSQGAAPVYTCTDSLGCLEIPSGSPIVIGILYASAGGAAPLGLDALDQVEQVVAEKDPLLGHKIYLIRAATDCTPESARAAATLLAQTSNLLAVIGPTCLSEYYITDPILLDAGIVPLTPYRPNARASAELLLAAIEQTSVRGRNGTLYIPRMALREALEKTGNIP